MEIIIKHGDFTLRHFSYDDSYFLYYKTGATWMGKFNELFDTKLLDYIFKLEPDPEKAVGFIDELLAWSFKQPGAFKIYEEYKQLNDKITTL